MQADITKAASIECCGVVCDERRLVEVEGGRVAVLIRREDLQQITLRHGLQAPHPILQIGMGVALTLLAYFPIVHLVHWARHGGTLFSFELWIIAFASLGAWLIVTAFRHGHFFEVETVHGRKRLAFNPRPEPVALDEFVKAVEQRYGLRVGRR